VKIAKVHPKYSELISMVPAFAELANIFKSLYYMITVVTLFCSYLKCL